MKKLVLILLSILMFTGCKNVSEDWRTQYDLGMRYLEEGDYEQAVIAFTASIETDPRQPEVYTARGDAYMLGAWPEDYILLAMADYETALELDEGFVQAYLKLADVCIGQGDYEKALELLLDYLSGGLNNECYSICVGFGYDYEEAVVFRDHAVETLREKGFDVKEIPIYQIGATISVHTGPYPLGFGILEKAIHS